MLYLWALFLFRSLCLQADAWSGDDYAKNSSVQLSHAERLLNGLLLKGNEHILDVGCGDGKITALLAERVPQGQVIGIDPSESMLIQAEKIAHPHLSFQQGRAEDFSLDQSFDHIVAIHVMHWIQDQEAALSNIGKALKPEGHVHLILAPSKEGLPFWTALQKTLKSWEKQFTSFVNPQQVFDIETYRQLLVKAGFHIEGLHYLYHESIHDNKEKLKSWIKQWQPHMKFLPAPEQKPFLDQLVDNYLIEMGIDPTFAGAVSWGEYVLIVDAGKSSAY